MNFKPFLSKHNFVLGAMILFFSVSLFPKLNAQDETQKSIQKFANALQIIDYAYVDSTDLPKLVESAIVEMLKELDPHSAYISKEEVEKVNEPLVGSFEGIGVSFQIYKDTILVIAPIIGGPSEKLGIMAGDKIVKIDGEDATGKKINNKYVMDHLRGKKGTKVTVSIKRDHMKELIDFTITRDKIPLTSIDATYMADPKIGYIKLTRFSKTSMKEFHESMAKLREQGMKNLILDLRGNSGGYLNVATDLADQFLTSGKLIVYTEGLRSPKQEFDATSSGDFEDGKLIVLINEASASASEIVSGAVQDWDRGLIVGRRSFGKGLVQRPFRLIDGSVIRLTTARYYTPSGRCIQKPYDEGAEEYYKDFKKRLEHGELVHPDSIHFPDSLKYFTHDGRVVYGGGGIMPDVFIPIDSTRFSDYYIDLVRKGVFNQFVMGYLDENRQTLNEQYSDVESFKKDFVVDDKMYDDFTAFAKEKEVERKKDDKYYYPDEDIKVQIKALLARNLWGVNAYFIVINQLDDDLHRAVELINDGKKFKELGLK